MKKILFILIMLIAAAFTASADDLYSGYNRGGYEIYVADCNIEADGHPVEVFMTVRDTKYNFTKIYNFQRYQDVFTIMKRMNYYTSFDFVEKLLGNEKFIDSHFRDNSYIEEYYVPSID